MPKWSPDRASMCDAPLILNASMISLLSRLRSPVISAVIIEFADLLLNGIPAIDSFRTALNSDAWPYMICGTGRMYDALRLT